MHLSAPTYSDAMKPLAHFQIAFIKIEITTSKLKIKVRFNKSHVHRDVSAVQILVYTNCINSNISFLECHSSLKCFEHFVCS